MKKFQKILMIAVTCSVVLSCTHPVISEWKQVAVISRMEIVIPAGWSSETEVSLKFSDGTEWQGSPSRSNSNEKPLLYLQEGDSIKYRYNSHYFTRIQWENK